MKKITYWMTLTLFASTLFFASCGDDIADEIDDIIEEIDTTVTVTNFVTDFNEVKNGTPLGEGFIGTVVASTNLGELSYSLKSETVTGALTVDASTGGLFVNERSIFDFETNEKIEAVVEVKNGTIVKDLAVTINLNNLPESFSLNGGTTSVWENVLNTEVIYTVTGSTDLGELVYSLDANDYFKIDPSSGEITLKDGANLDYESITERTAGSDYKTIIVQANGENSIDPSLGGSVGVTILVEDVYGATEVEERLRADQTPAQIVAANPSLEDDLYGEQYQGGIIATFNSSTGSGLIMTIDGAGTDRNWSQSNAYANALVKNGYSDWRLMTAAESDVMCDISNSVAEENYDGFWTSTNCGGSCYNWKNFSNNNACGGGGSPSSQTWSIVRAVRAYN